MDVFDLASVSKSFRNALITLKIPKIRVTPVQTMGATLEEYRISGEVYDKALLNQLIELTERQEEVEMEVPGPPPEGKTQVRLIFSDLAIRQVPGKDIYRFDISAKRRVG